MISMSIKIRNQKVRTLEKNDQEINTFSFLISYSLFLIL